MNIEVTFAEIVQFVREKYGHTITLSSPSPDTFVLETDVRKAFISHHVVVFVKLERISGTDICFSYSFASQAARILVASLLPLFSSWLREKLPMTEIGSDTLVVHLARINQLKSVLPIITLSSLSFTPTTLHLSITPNFK